MMCTNPSSRFSPLGHLLRVVGPCLALAVLVTTGVANARTGPSAVLALPYLADGGAETYAKISRDDPSSGAPYVLRIVALDGDVGSDFAGQSLACRLDPLDSTQVRVRGVGGGAAEMSADCRPQGGGAKATLTRPISGERGALFVALEDPATGLTVSVDAIAGEATLFDFGAGSSWSTDAIGFRAGTGPNDGDRTYRFDGTEYELSRAGAVVDIEAATADVDPKLVLFVPDGTSGDGGPLASLAIFATNADAMVHNASYDFSGFEVVRLADIDPNLADPFFGTATGQLEYTVTVVNRTTDGHDSWPSIGNGDQLRRAPVLAWVLRDAVLGSDAASGAKRTVPADAFLPPATPDDRLPAFRFLEDPDGDGIESPIDVEPDAFSDAFDDTALGGGTAGVVTDRGDQSLRIGRAGTADDIEVETRTEPGATAVAFVDVCGGVATLVFGDGALGTYSCGSVALRVELGLIRIEFLLNGAPASIDVGGGNAVVVDPENGTATADPGNPDFLVVETAGGSIELPPGESLQVDVEIEIRRKPVFPWVWNFRRFVSVAVLSTDNFGADDVVRQSLAFGPAGAAPWRFFRRDVNRDGRKDLVARFKVRDVELDAEDEEACMTGQIQTPSGPRSFLACDALTRKPAWWW